MATAATFLNEQQWHPEKIISGMCQDFQGGYSCMILNRKISVPPLIVQNIWQNAKIRCTVDGATNRWKDFLGIYCQGKTMKPPDFITGDFDSITQETLTYFNDPNIKKIHTPDQNETDFTKAIGVISSSFDEKQISDLFVVTDTSGRIDHIMANINTLLKVHCNNFNVYLLTGNSLTWILGNGMHSINIPKNLFENKRWCSLIPIRGKSNVTTTGLKWNLSNSTLEFGGIVSTSNTYASEVVTVQTNNFILWSMGVFSFHDD